LYGLAQAEEQPLAIALVASLAPLYGIAIWFITTSIAGRRAERKGPEIVSYLASN